MSCSTRVVERTEPSTGKQGAREVVVRGDLGEAFDRVPLYVAIAAVFNGLVALIGPLVVALHISDLEEQFEFVKSGGDYTIIWRSLIGGLATYVTGLFVTAGPPRQRFSAAARRLTVAAFTFAQLGIALGAYCVSPQQPWG